MIKFAVIVVLTFANICLAQEETKPYSRSEKNSGLTVRPRRQEINSFSSGFVKPIFTGGYDSLRMFIENTVELPERTSEVKDSTLIHVSFDIDTKGRVRMVEIIGRDRMKEMTALEIEAIRVVKAIPNWQPALINGQPYKCNSTVSVPFFYSPD